MCTKKKASPLQSNMIVTAHAAMRPKGTHSDTGSKMIVDGTIADRNLPHLQQTHPDYNHEIH